jgi:hypothetical protein
LIKPLKVFLFVSLSSLVLAACGSSTSTSGTSPSKDTPAPSSSQTQVSDKPAAGSQPAEAGTANTKEEKSIGQAESKNSIAATPTPAKEKQIELDSKGTKHAKGTLFESSNTPLYIYTIPGYEVSDSKANKEIVVTSKNETVKMTVTPLEKGVDMDKAKKTAMEDMQKISKNVKEITTLKKDKFYQDATVLYASNPKEIESVYLLSVDGTPLKVTIQRPEKTDSILPYLQAMMKTIGAKS